MSGAFDPRALADENFRVPLCTDTGIQWIRPADAAVVWRPAPLRELLAGEDSGLDATSPARAAGELGGCERGSVGILVLFMGLLIFALAAMVWNTGEITTAKIEAQTAADSAAYSSAVWTSRGINIVAASNMQILRDASAATTAMTIGSSAWVWFGWALALVISDTITTVSAASALAAAIAANVAALGTLTAGVVAAAAALANAISQLVLSVKDLTLAITILSEIGWIQPFFDFADLYAHISDLFAYQEAWVREIPQLIEIQRQQFEAYYDCDISLRHGAGHGLDSAAGGAAQFPGMIRAPLRVGRADAVTLPFVLRYLYDAFAAGGWYSDERLKSFSKVKPKPVFLAAGAVSAVAGLLKLDRSFHTLTSVQVPFLEFGPEGVDASTVSWPDFTVVAVARKRTENTESLQKPRRPLGFMAADLFGPADDLRPTAYAAAETFNGVDGLLSSFTIGGINVGQGLFSPYPWRVWTDWGWQWTPRLTHGAYVQGGEVDEAFAEQGFDVGDAARTAAMH